MLLWTAVVAALLRVSMAEMEESIEINIPCGEKLQLDEAQIHFTSNDPNVQLFGTNLGCWECTESLLAASQSADMCTGVYAPHGWYLYAYTVDTNLMLLSTEYAFGEHGHYNVTYDRAGNELTVAEVRAPIDSMAPLWTLAAVLAGVFVVAFGALPAYDALCGTPKGVKTGERKSSHDVSLKGLADNPSVTEAPTDGSAAPLLAAEGTVGLAGAPVSKPKPKAERLASLDTFRGIALAIMIFANYGAGGYWFLDHSAWNGLTLADLVFPWFMFMMGVSMSMSYASIFKKAAASNVSVGVTKSQLAYKAVRRTGILFALGLFYNNGYDLGYWRIPGVLQYFAFSYFVTSFTVLGCMAWTQDGLRDIEARERADRCPGGQAEHWRAHPEDTPLLVRWLGDAERNPPSAIMLAYRTEWAVQLCLVAVYLSVSLGAAAPGCPRGYQGPGGIGDNGDYPECTAGIHRWIDIQLFGSHHMYLEPTCKRLYDCIGYDPEGTLGALTTCTLTYIGLMTGRVLVHFKGHSERLKRWFLWAFIILLVCGSLCGFSQNDGLVPINKNLWSTSFGLFTSGTGIIGLALCYIIIDMNVGGCLGFGWTGAPFNYLGMNSILFFMGQDLLGEHFPFSYQVDESSHGQILTSNVVGVASWCVVAWWCWKNKFFVKI